MTVVPSRANPGLCFVFILVAAFSCRAQTTPAPVLPQPAGVENAWDVRTVLGNLIKDTGDLRTLVQNLNPQRWAQEKGAPTTYILQWQSLDSQLKDTVSVTKSLAQQTDHLALALDDYFRFEAADTAARSLLDGVRKYDERATAEKMNALLARNFDDRGRLRSYIRDLAESIEQNYKIADSEAQRCRAELSRQPQSSPKRLRK